jgi:hypothetical protein
MKKAVILALALFWAVSALAQYAVAPDWYQGDLKKKGTVLALQGEKLDRAATEAILNQVGGPEMVAAWDKYRKERGWGIGLTAGGYTLAAAGFCFGGVYVLAGVIGTMFAAIGGQEAVDKLWADLGPMVQVGGVAMFTGLAAGTTGVVLLCVGNGNMRKLAKACDAAGLASVTDVQLTFGPTPSGVGLALRF